MGESHEWRLVQWSQFGDTDLVQHHGTADRLSIPLLAVQHRLSVSNLYFFHSYIDRSGAADLGGAAQFADHLRGIGHQLLGCGLRNRAYLSVAGQYTHRLYDRFEWRGVQWSYHPNLDDHGCYVVFDRQSISLCGEWGLSASLDLQHRYTHGTCACYGCYLPGFASGLLGVFGDL